MTLNEKQSADARGQLLYEASLAITKFTLAISQPGEVEQSLNRLVIGPEADVAIARTTRRPNDEVELCISSKEVLSTQEYVTRGCSAADVKRAICDFFSIGKEEMAAALEAAAVTTPQPSKRKTRAVKANQRSLVINSDDDVSLYDMIAALGASPHAGSVSPTADAAVLVCEDAIKELSAESLRRKWHVKHFKEIFAANPGMDSGLVSFQASELTPPVFADDTVKQAPFIAKRDAIMAAVLSLKEALDLDPVSDAARATAQ